MPTHFERDFQYAKKDLELPEEVSKLDIFGIKDPSKFSVPKKIKKIIRAKETREAGNKESAIVKAENPEGKEIVFDFEEIKEHWQDFYKKHGIDAQIPDIKLTREQKEEVEELIEEFGFDKALIIPEDLPDHPELHQKMTQGYHKTFQGNGFKKDGSFGGVEDLKRGFKLVFTKDVQNTIKDDFFKQTANLSPEDPSAPNDLKRFIENIKQEKSIELEGLALSDYLIFQREYFERTQKHLDTEGSTWLIGSKTKGSVRIPLAGWGAYDELDVFSDLPSETYPCGRCRFAKSFELKK